MKKFIIIDANSLIHRAFHALPPLTNKDGVVVNAVYGFATIFLKALKDLKPDYVACCFDVSKDTFRRAEFAEYKAHRKEQPQELYDQMDLVKELLEAFNIKIYAKKGFEADDLIGTIATHLSKKHAGQVKTIIASGDLDTLQLINAGTEVYTLKRGLTDTAIYDTKAVKERYGFGPEKMVDYKALRGDPSDNIPGVKGIGEKTAMELINKFGSLEEIYKYVEDESRELEVGKQKPENRNQKTEIKDGVIKKLIEHKKEALMSQRLSQIKCDVDIDFELEDCKVMPFDTARVVELFQEWNFSSLIGKIPQASELMYQKQGTLFQQTTNNQQQTTDDGRQTTTEDIKLKKGYQLIDSEEKYNKFLSELKKQEMFALDTETDGLNPFENKLIGISFSWEAGEAYYLPVQQTTNNKQLTTELKDVLEDKKIKKIGHNMKFDYEVLENFGIKMQGLFFDTMIASYLLNPGTRQHNLEALAFVELGYKMQPITDLIGVDKKTQITLSEVPVVAVANYSGEDADITWRLCQKLSEKLDEALIEGVLQKIEMPLVTVLAEMEKTGIKIDVKFLNKMSQELEARIKKLESRIYKLAGTEFNVASPKQLKEILFEKMKISTTGIGKTKTGLSTSAEELEKLRGRHEIIDLIMEFREFSKLKNTYLDPLPSLADKNNRVHTSFNQTVTATGRLSSSEPNLQNIPIRGDLGREVRRAFIADKGNKIVAADYSQIELRIVASLADDKKMLKAFRQKEDIHTQTAAEIFDVEENKVTADQRRAAKVVNFGVIYGLGPRGLAAGTGLSYEEAANFIDKYFEVFDGVKTYIENTIELARENGFVETLFGRRRYLPEIKANHPQLRAAAERMAINHPVQGTAADLIKLAMVKIDERIKKDFPDGEVKMLLQVHDELIFEVREDVTEAAVKMIKKEMESVYVLKAPIVAEVEVGESWGEAK
ncbi:MAG: DNA polymerase I [Patescibacteria group bacterium]|nr:DNA polymerase I [Patescibacteria group bacterium]